MQTLIKNDVEIPRIESAEIYDARRGGVAMSEAYPQSHESQPACRCEHRPQEDLTATARPRGRRRASASARRTALAGCGAIVLAATAWGAIGPAMTLLPDSATSVTVATARIAIGAVGFLPLMVRRPGQVAGLMRRGVRGWVVAAIVASMVTQVTLMTGLTLAGVAIGTLIHMGLCPVFTAMIERVLHGTRLTLRWWFAAVPAVGGCTALVLDGRVAAGPHLILGVVAAAVSSLSYSAFAVCSSKLIRAGHGSTALMATVFCGTALTMAPLWWLYPMGWILTPSGAAVMLFIGLVATSGAYWLYGFGLQHTSSSTSAVLVLAEPATAAVLAFALLGEHLGQLGLGGLIAVFAALTVAVIPGRRPGQLKVSRMARRVGPRHLEVADRRNPGRQVQWQPSGQGDRPLVATGRLQPTGHSG